MAGMRNVIGDREPAWGWLKNEICSVAGVMMVDVVFKMGWAQLLVRGEIEDLEVGLREAGGVCGVCVVRVLFNEWERNCPMFGGRALNEDSHLITIPIPQISQKSSKLDDDS